MADTDPWAQFRVAAPAADDPWAKFRAKPVASTADATVDAAKSLGIGTVKGGIGLVGAGGDVSDLVAAGAGKVGDAFGSDPEKAAAAMKYILSHLPIVGPVLSGPTSSKIQKSVEGVTGEFHKPETTAGEYAQTIGEFLPATLAGPGGVARRVLMQDVVPAVASEAAGQATKGTDAETLARVGGALGGPAALRVAGTVAAPVSSRVAPQWFANEKITQALRRGGMTAEDVERELTQAAAEGQPYAVADALGNSGQRLLSGVARQPHEERQAVAEFLDARQAGQGRRVANALAEGFDAPDTAARRTATLTAAREAADDTAFTAVRAGNAERPVDLSRAIARIDQTLRPGVNQIARPASGIADDSIEGALASVRSRLTDDRSVLTDFQGTMRARDDLADKITLAHRAGEGNKVRLLTQVRNEIDAALENASSGYRAAMRQSAENARPIEAVDIGRGAAARGRPEDTIPAFQAMSPNQQSAFRAGYVDPLIEQAQGSAVGVNKVRPLLNDATAREFPAFAAPGQADQLQRRLGREQRMFETRGAATGGSRTADNLADQADVTHLGTTALRSLFTGDITHAAGSALARLMAEATGTSPRVAERLARILIETDPARFREISATAARQADNGSSLARLLARSALAGQASQEGAR